MTRQEWLHKIAERLIPLFPDAGLALPEFSVTVGITTGKDGHVDAIGQCFHSDNRCVNRLYVSPLIKTGLQASETLVHEMVHAAAGRGAKHGPAFRRVAVKVGLVGRMTCTVAGPRLAKTLNDLEAEIGPYPPWNGSLLLAEFDDRMRTVACVGVPTVKPSQFRRRSEPRSDPRPADPVGREYPRWMFHATVPALLVDSKEQEQDLGAEWTRIYSPEVLPPPVQPEPPAVIQTITNALLVRLKKLNEDLAEAAPPPIQPDHEEIIRKGAEAVKSWQELWKKLGH